MTLQEENWGYKSKQFPFLLCLLRMCCYIKTIELPKGGFVVVDDVHAGHFYFILLFFPIFFGFMEMASTN